MGGIVARGKIRPARERQRHSFWALLPRAGCAWGYGTRKEGYAFSFFPGFHPGLHWVTPPAFLGSTLTWWIRHGGLSAGYRGGQHQNQHPLTTEGTKEHREKQREKPKTPPGLPQGVQRRCHTCMVEPRWVNGWNYCSRENTELQEKGKGIRFGRFSRERDARGPFDSPTLWDHLEGRLFGRRGKENCFAFFLTQGWRLATSVHAWATLCHSCGVFGLCLMHCCSGALM